MVCVVNKILGRTVAKITIPYYTEILRKIQYEVGYSAYLYKPELVKIDQEHDDHVYHFPQNIDINIEYSIPVVWELADETCKKSIIFADLKKMLRFDLEQSKEDMDVLRRHIKNRRKHKSKFLIVMYHVPNNTYLLLDGRHRFVEYEKFASDTERVPVLLVDSEKMKRAIITKAGFIAYCIQRNFYIFQNFPIWEWGKLLSNIRYLVQKDSDNFC